ncbi:hypothetical protein KP509_07G055700 [Ceratopteris richardii]|uniref:Retrovirus-related Pol polyprotein from transposon TNT 1-94-like beta-barrel domain-containing protein n=1 Tax=Ceratopteris richardii TaxID=49495 RepID=A0A8T2UI14_CERRI|nr:hypothetical protein KP509_07G055700 [Ceratopteris richardii]
MFDNELSTIIIHGLQDGYEGLVQGLIILREKPSLEEMEQIFRDEDQRQAAMKSIHDGGKASTLNDKALFSSRGRGIFNAQRGRGWHQPTHNQDRQNHEAHYMDGEGGNEYTHFEEDSSLVSLEEIAAHTHDPKEEPWWIDSGEVSHMTSHAQYFSNIDNSHNGTIFTTYSTPNSIAGKGDIPIRLGTGEKKMPGNVLLVPSLTKNLLLVGAMTEKGLKIEFEG